MQRIRPGQSGGEGPCGKHRGRPEEQGYSAGGPESLQPGNRERYHQGHRRELRVLRPGHRVRRATNQRNQSRFDRTFPSIKNYL